MRGVCIRPTSSPERIPFKNQQTFVKVQLFSYVFFIHLVIHYNYRMSLIEEYLNYCLCMVYAANGISK